MVLVLVLMRMRSHRDPDQIDKDVEEQDSHQNIHDKDTTELAFISAIGQKVNDRRRLT